MLSFSPLSLRVYVLERNAKDHTVGLKLTLKNLHSDPDDGVYECRATFADGRDTLTRRVKLEVISKFA